MKSALIVVILFLVSQQVILSQNIPNNLTNPTRLDSIVHHIIDDIDSNSVRSFIQELQDFETRYFLADNRKDIASWIANKFIEFGYVEVAIDSFSLSGGIYGNSTHYNVIVTLPGTINPDEIFLFGAHYDSRNSNDPTGLAPGADDNATGVAGILEIARVIMQKGFKPEQTIMFVSHSVEEAGLKGAHDFAQKAKDSGMDIQLMIDIDMIGYTPFPLDSSSVSIAVENENEEHYLTATKCLEKYTVLNSRKILVVGDSEAYRNAGFQTVGFFESDLNPNYHTETDLIEFLSMPYCTEIVKTACATMLSAMYQPAYINQLNITDHIPGESVYLDWPASENEDIVGYNIYIGSQSREYDMTINLTETNLFVDSLENSTTYYFGISVVDEDGIESSIFEKKYTPFIFTLDLGILVVDDTDNSDFTDQEDDSFYRDILSKYEVAEYDLWKKKKINITDIGAYSTIIWHSCDASGKVILQDFRSDLARYLEAGGNFIYAGLYPERAFVGMWDSGEYKDGDFIYDYLKVKEVRIRAKSRFIQAISESPYYPNIHVDTTKTDSEYQYHLRGVQGLYSSPESSEIFIYDSEYDSSSVSGELLNQPVGVEYLGEDYNSIILSFPMYYMEQESARQFFEVVLTEKFNEPTGVKDISEVVSEYNLAQNYPNPFNPSTVIQYSIPSTQSPLLGGDERGGLSSVKLIVYDILGREVATLVNEHQRPGNYEVSFNSANLTSGVYFYTLNAGNFRDTKKMIFLK